MLENINNFILIILLLTAAFFDCRKNKIPNLLTFPAMLTGLILNIIMNGSSGLLFSFYGFVFGLTIFFIPFAFGLMGAGDVKLMAAVGALKGFRLTVMSALFSSAVGLIVVIGYLIYKKKIFSYFLKYFIHPKPGISGVNEKLYVPYGLAIALGTLFALWWNYNIYLQF